MEAARALVPRAGYPYCCLADCNFASIQRLHALEVTTNKPPTLEVLRSVSYGPHERQVLDFWRAKGESPRPVVVFIHGGGWTNGSTSSSYAAAKPYLEHGISYAAIAYRLAPDNPLPAPVHDAARAVQFLRHKADKWNINKGRIAAIGGSAGGCSSLWLAFRDDLADPDAEDPVLRESTRLAAAAARNAQTSIDPIVIEEWIGPNVLKHRMIWMAVGEKSMADALANYKQHQDLYREFSPINHFSADDPPVMLTYSHPTILPSANANHGIHHPAFGVRLKEKSEHFGNEVHLLVNEEIQESQYQSISQFLIDKLSTQNGNQ